MTYAAHQMTWLEMTEITETWINYYCVKLNFREVFIIAFLATLVALHFTPVSKSVSRS